MSGYFHEGSVKPLSFLMFNNHEDKFRMIDVTEINLSPNLSISISTDLNQINQS